MPAVKEADRGFGEIEFRFDAVLVLIHSGKIEPIADSTRSGFQWLIELI